MSSQSTAGWTACKYTSDDEAIHEAPREAGYNESVYFNFACDDAQERFAGGLFRLALRPEDGYAEFTLICNQRDGTTLFKYAKAGLGHDDVTPGDTVFSCEGLSVSVEEPTRRWSIRYRGEARLLPDLAKFGDAPGVEWRAAESLDVDLDLTWEATHPMHMLSEHGGLHHADVKLEQDPGARNHYEQWGLLSGELTLGDERVALEPAQSLRDHSWGRRVWDTIPISNQIMAYFDNGARIVTLNTLAEDGSYFAHGTAWLPGQDEPAEVPSFDGIDEYSGESSIVELFPLDLLVGDRPVHLTAHVVAMFPTRVGTSHRDALALVRFSGDLGSGGGWIDLFRARRDRPV